MHGRALFASFFLPSRHIRKNLFSFSFSTFWGLLLSDWIYFALLLVFQFYISLNSHIFPRAFYTFIPLARNHDNRIEFFPFLLREARNLFLSVLNSFCVFLNRVRITSRNPTYPLECRGRTEPTGNAAKISPLRAAFYYVERLPSVRYVGVASTCSNILR
jgi:hypothetical protein